MSADRLREAARVLRERATDAGYLGAIWTNQREQQYGPSVVTDGFGDVVAACDPEEDEGAPVAAYIATMRPDVGLALADLLDVQALHFPVLRSPKAWLALADLILGGAA